MSHADKIFDLVEWEALPPTDSNDGELPYATHKGVLKLGEIELECVVLNDGRRLFFGEKVEELVRGLFSQ